MNIDIFGSCVTRDAFAFKSNNHTVSHYNARSSLISATTNPLSINIPPIKTLQSNFKKRSVEWDLTKYFSQYAKNPKANTIIIDLFDERFDIFKCDNSIFTLSNEYNQAKINLDIERITKAEHLILFEKNIVKISELFKNYQNVILHKIKPNKRYYDESSIKQQLFTNHTTFLYNNSDYYFKILEDNIPNLKTIEIKGYLGDINHKWGQSPLHFEDGYYHEFNKALDYVLTNNRNYYSQKEQFHIEEKSAYGFEISIDNDSPTAVYVYKNKEVLKKIPYTKDRKITIKNLPPGKYRFKFFVRNRISTDTFLSNYYSIVDSREVDEEVKYVLESYNYDTLWIYHILKAKYKFNGILVDNDSYIFDSDLNLKMHTFDSLSSNTKIVTNNLGKKDNPKYECISTNIHSENILTKYLSTLGTIKLYRLSRELYLNNLEYGAKFVWQYIKKFSTCSISYKTIIGDNFELGLGGLSTVVHPLAKIGENVKIAQQVTIGFNGSANGLNGPVIGNNVYIAPGSMCLGGKIGNNVIIGANSTVLTEIPSNCVVAGSPAKIISTDIEKYKNFLPLRDLY